MSETILEHDAQKQAVSTGKDKSRSVKNRVQFDFAPRSMERLNILKAKTEAASYAEVVKNALRLYEALIEETERGREFYVKENGSMSPYKMFL